MSTILTLIGLSMLPTYPSGSVVAVNTAFPFAQLHKGDVITFVSPFDASGTTTHRVFEVHPSWIWTKGDNNAHPDAIRVTIKNYVGKVVHADATTAFPVKPSTK